MIACDWVLAKEFVDLVLTLVTILTVVAMEVLERRMLWNRLTWMVAALRLRQKMEKLPRFGKPPTEVVLYPLLVYLQILRDVAQSSAPHAAISPR